VKALRNLLRIFSYFFNGMFAAVSLAMAVVILASGPQTVNFSLLPVSGRPQAYWLIGLGLLGIVILLAAVRGKGQPLYAVWTVFAFALVVRFPPETRRDARAIGNLLVSAPDGRKVPLSQLARIESEEGPAEIARDNGQRRISLEVNVRGRDIGGSSVGQRQHAVSRLGVEAKLEVLGLDRAVDRRVAVHGFRQPEQGLVEGQLSRDVVAEQVDEELHGNVMAWVSLGRAEDSP